MPRTHRKKAKYQRTMATLTIVTLVFIFITIFFFKSKLSSVNIEVQKLKKEVAKQEKVNESYTMKVNQLISLENMQLVAAQEGLEYNNNNVIVIQK